ncbi:hypothetical protein JR316_0010524 [Psilocybe cubensis]|uniref:Uncharacterized protein n=2 Tax=Psilocybe cubensis TaxID=181762 RepID=A0ACB8GM39_PSICU|nr:hypothetical protein JR316_0010524 [Psilocybe cubensis]KAH9476611.1 hypothetical protein JR316_0010524 [Psilocybe cubensis]
MAPSYYESLSTEEDSEEKLLANTEDQRSATHTGITRESSNKFNYLSYILIFLSIVASGISLKTTLTAVRASRAYFAPTDTLPRPNVFVGLPKYPQVSKHSEVGSHMDHSHSRN